MPHNLKGINMTNRASFNNNRARLSSEFGENLARKYFGDSFIDSLPRYVKGDKKGLLKGFVDWEKCIKGGWVGGYDGGYVERRVNKIVKIKIIETVWRGDDICLMEITIPRL